MDHQKIIRELYIRTCKDSGYQLEWAKAAKFVADELDTHPLQVWVAFPSMEDMKKIAEGKQ